MGIRKAFHAITAASTGAIMCLSGLAVLTTDGSTVRRSIGQHMV